MTIFSKKSKHHTTKHDQTTAAEPPLSPYCNDVYQGLRCNQQPGHQGEHREGSAGRWFNGEMFPNHGTPTPRTIELAEWDGGDAAKNRHATQAIKALAGLGVQAKTEAADGCAHLLIEQPKSAT